MKDKLITIQEASERLGVHPETLRRWHRKGKIKAVIVSDRGDRRFRLSDINKIIERK